MTTDPDNRLRLLSAHVRALAPELRATAQNFDDDPGNAARLCELPLLARLATLQIPPEYAPDPLVLDGQPFYLVSAEERVVFHEEAAAYGDVSLLLSSPGSLTAGMLVATLGDHEQKKWFFGRLHECPTWTFLAMTEPWGGSDATAMRTSLVPAEPDGSMLLLNGTKTYVGNATRSRMGVVFARTGPGPLGIRAVLLDTASVGFRANPIDTIGLRGALGTMVFEDVQIPQERLLGRQLPTSRRGMWGWLHSFGVLRCVAAAMGVGVARAAVDYAVGNLPSPTRQQQHRVDALWSRIEGVRRLTHRAAQVIDADDAHGQQLAAAAKTSAAQLAEEVTLAALGLLGPGARLDHPLLDKWARDARGIEFMEGTSNIQRLAVFNALVRDGLDPERIR